MAKVVVVLTGQVASGKTTLCNKLVERFGFHAFKTKECIKKLAKDIAQERVALQRYGDLLDRRTKGTWVCDELDKELRELNNADISVVVDAARIPQQIEALRRGFGRRVVHIHLHTPRKIRLTKSPSGRVYI